MSYLKELCVPRQSVFDTQRRDTVLDISDLIAGRIEPDAFFEENFVTDGMKVLLRQSFLRLEGLSDQGVFRLKQAMGGGKTHNLLTLGLLAKHPEYRQKVMGKFHQVDKDLGEIKVVAFTGRESDSPLGIWGSIAEQLGKRDHFKDLYSPLQAPGQTAWEKLLENEAVLILLDELPPYFENARSKAIGNSDLAKVSATALSNLLVAIGRPSCSRVCLVISDLTAAYTAGVQQISTILADFEHETHRSAQDIEPVRMNSDELFHILRKRIFETLPSEHEITEVAQLYVKALREARQMDIINETPEQIATRIQSAYPFHPAIRDLYARFKENPGFQQTRGLIRIMRIVVSHMWNSGESEKRHLISAHDIDFNDRDTRTEISQINNTLENAIAHDIADEGHAVAEILDNALGGRDARDVCRLIFMSSLANVANPVIGLQIPTLIYYLAEPGRNIARLKTEVLEKLATSAWYLHSDRDGKLFFKNVENLNAKLESLVRAYLPEQAIRELRERLEELFKPNNGWCYQKILALPALDEISLEQDKVTLVITEPYTGGGLAPAVREFYEQATWKNRVAFLTGPRNTYETLLDTGKRLKAIKHIIDDMTTNRIPENDPQMVQAKELSDRIKGNFHSAVRETFIMLWYPPISDQPGLANADFSMRFDGNRYDGEQQIRDLLLEKQKFTEDISSDTFRKKCEQRLFTIQSMPWIEVKRRAGMLPKWQWHIPSALDDLKNSCITRDVWRENGGYIDKGPFPQPKTRAEVQEKYRDDNTGEVTLRVTAVNGDIIYYDFGASATTASARLEGSELKTNKMRASFLVVDSKRVHETGDPVLWKNRITLKYRFFQNSANSGRMLELKAAPEAQIYYTTEGSDPKIAGATYAGSFLLPSGATVVLAYAEQDGIESQVERITIPTETERTRFVVEPLRPALWKRHFECQNTKDSYESIEFGKKFKAEFIGINIIIMGESGNNEWLELSTYHEKQLTPELIEDCLSVLRKLQGNGQVKFSWDALQFQTGQSLLEWVETIKTELKPGEVSQT